MTQQEQASGLSAAKIPCPETGIEIRRTLCDICSPVFHCGIDAYVKDGVIIKVEGTQNHPVNQGRLCTKGLSNRAYLYRKDRLLTPLKRVGPRGEGTFEPISWEQAYRELSQNLKQLRARCGAESTAFFSGYSKWYRHILERFCYSYGSPNYGSESSTCFISGVMAWQVATGLPARCDYLHSGLFLGWAFNSYYSRYTMPAKIAAMRERGMKVIIIDPRVTPAAVKLADLHLRPRLGTDGALAHGIANLLISHGWVNQSYIDRYVHGFEPYREYVSQFDPQTVQRLTGVPPDQLLRAAELIRDSASVCINESSAPLAHHHNGMQNYRAVMALSALTGSYDRRGGQIPSPFSFGDVSSGFPTRQDAFIDEVRPQNAPLPVGAERFPLWHRLQRQMQSTDLSRQILEEKPYPIRAVFALGMNHRMFPNSEQMRQALCKLDYFVDVDLFMTDTARYADLVLPACTSFERGEFKCYPQGRAVYTKPVIAPLGQAKSDVDILCELAREMELGDPLLERGYDACIEYMIQDLHTSIDQLRQNDLPVQLPDYVPSCPGRHLEEGLPTPTGKFELYSELIAANPQWGLEPLPVYVPPADGGEAFPMTLCTGARIPNSIHSRLQGVPWERAVHPGPLAEISLEDAARLDVSAGDRVCVSTAQGELTLEARPTSSVLPGEVYLPHGFREMDANLLTSSTDNDPYSGFPVYRSTPCSLRKEV